MAADYLDELSSLRKVKQILSLFRNDKEILRRVVCYETESTCAISVIDDSKPYYYKSRLVHGHGDAFEEAVLDAVSKFSHLKIQTILKSSATMSSLP